ncbi:MAG: SDR family oxidoreductase [Chloroflexi bacterium]|nr:MAG: SDR family oxidoreductase [Chloroflexota bacterium]
MSPKVVLITGAASGIGRHWASVLLARGDKYRLVLTDVDEAGLRAAFSAGEGVLLHGMDVRSAEQWQRVLDETLAKYGRLDYLFNIAGGGRPAFFLQQPLENIHWILDVNLKGPLIGMKLAGEIMLQQGQGHIINVASLAGLSPTPGNALYSAAKGGLRNASLAAAIEWRKKGVAVTVISPDLVDTPIMQRHLESGGPEVALTYTGVTLTVHDLEHAFWKAMHKRPLEINIPRWRGWLTKLNHAFPALMLVLYEPMKRRGLKRLEKIRQERGITPHD